jgi:hypothetical protein
VPFDIITVSVLMGSICGPICAYQASAVPAQPWASVPAWIRLLVIVSLAATVIFPVVLVAIGRWPLALLLVVASGVSYLASRHRRRVYARRGF